jgi:enolase
VRTTISQVHGRRIWDSRARPTVEVDVTLAGGVLGRAIAPAGASTGTGEALDLRDGGEAFGGYDVRTAVEHVNGEIANRLQGRDAADQRAIDQLLVEIDGTPNKSRLGGNAIVATSMAVLQAAAAANHLPLWRYLQGNEPARLPLPEIQIFGGGAHADRRVDIQDFMVICPTARSFAEALDHTAEVYRAAGRLLKARGLLQGVADEGGYWPAFESNEQALELLCQAIAAAGFGLGTEVAISLDVAAAQFGAGGRYRLARDGRDFGTDELTALLLGWIDRYPILSIEDPFAPDDETGFRQLMDAVGERVQIVGDDLLVSDMARVQAAAAKRLCNAALIKPNQAGTVSEAKAALDAARAAGMATIASARSGESEDVTIAHLAVGWAAGQIKVGSIARGERTAKWNEILRIEAAISAAVFSNDLAFLADTGRGGLARRHPANRTSHD